ncbi:dTDP-4-dehydrorhamnose 3,5-epimerase [Sulfurovum sp. XGS-02]|uniref:dTDP-4-dehydrorhamnose 3,5-epimerase n=1 Tax=Sulfurovum sp. XGS-02 TaxID=2925411 RepID=UPI00205885B1|nr:dTDP-4-dehydrorhamnose 3,5-epimerase [Sulfurovum sp. XGS-02]UPT76815.1 dTDP-4-dehydrorhamnose 3,5-epimerase [Sulfurovum sp. XGS-02]
MKFIKTKIPDVIMIEPDIFADDRGYFMETYRSDKLQEALGFNIDFLQDNESKSSYGVLRGLHFQLPPFAQSKLARAIKGKILDIAVDIRKGSPTFGKYVAVELSEENKRMLFIPRGFAHGFVVLSEEAILSYKVDNYYAREFDRGIAFDDPTLNIDWQINPDHLLLSDKDKKQPLLLDTDKLFDYDEDLYG